MPCLWGVTNRCSARVKAKIKFFGFMKQHFAMMADYNRWANARLYEATRPGYPPELAGFIADVAGAVAGSAVLEVGAGA